jgi:hypothetical protein
LTKNNIPTKNEENAIKREDIKRDFSISKLQDMLSNSKENYKENKRENQKENEKENYKKSHEKDYERNYKENYENNLEKDYSEDDKDDESNNESGRTLASDQKKQSYELQFILNKLYINHTAEKLSNMMAGRQIGNKAIGNMLKIQKGFLTSNEIKTLKNAGIIIEEIENDISFDGVSNKNQIKRQGTEQQPNAPEQKPMAVRVTMTHNPNEPIIIEPIEPDKVSKPTVPPRPYRPTELSNPSSNIPTKSNTPETQRPNTAETTKQQEQTMSNGSIDNYKLDMNPNGMSTSCTICYYTEEQRNALIRIANNSLRNMLDSKKHLTQYYKQKEEGQQQQGQQGTGWSKY